MSCNFNRHVCLADLEEYLKRTDYLNKYTPAEQEEIRKNIGAVGQEDLDQLVATIIKENRYTELTYEELKKHIENKSLKIGGIYCVTDFQSIYESNYVVNKIPQTWGDRINPSNTCQLLLTAAFVNILYPKAMLISDDPNSYKWDVIYDPECKTLSDGISTKGEITYLKDHNNNSAHYDFKNIRFRRTKSELRKVGFEISTPYKDVFTFNDEDLHENSNNVFNNELNSWNTVFLASCNDNKLNVKNSTFGSECSNNNLKGQNNNFKNPIIKASGTIDDSEDVDILSEDINKTIIKHNNTYFINYLDLETLTMQCYKHET